MVVKMSRTVNLQILLNHYFNIEDTFYDIYRELSRALVRLHDFLDEDTFEKLFKAFSMAEGLWSIIEERFTQEYNDVIIRLKFEKMLSLVEQVLQNIRIEETDCLIDCFSCIDNIIKREAKENLENAVMNLKDLIEKTKEIEIEWSKEP